MIFATVGTYYCDELVIAMDNIIDEINDNIVIQIGYGKYIPKRANYFRFKKTLFPYYQKADLIVGQGGAGTIFELLHMGKHFIGINNPEVPDEHQIELLQKLSNEGYILWCNNSSAIKKYITLAKTFKFRKYTPPVFFMDKIIFEFLDRQGSH